ncbi:uncharacterized protein [Palaemon carinicauda]|uniref:uncharacterized protein n=1 Tax=Palaemon carinicauda TaxID=392227 RepID=UPI0035B653D9
MCCGGEILNIIGAYAPQVGCTEYEKGNIRRDVDGVMQELEEHERVIVGADLNGHTGSENEAIGRCMGAMELGRETQKERIGNECTEEDEEWECNWAKRDSVEAWKALGDEESREDLEMKLERCRQVLEDIDKKVEMREDIRIED